MFPVLSFTPRDYFYKANLYILIPFAFAARPPQHLATISLFFVSVSSILFCLFFYFVF